MKPHTLTFDLPFLPNRDYAAFLNKHNTRVHSLHFSAQMPELHDARPKGASLELETLIRALQIVPGPKHYLLLNTRFHTPQMYGDERYLRTVLHVLQCLLDSGVLNGIVYADHYQLQALADASPKLCACVEAVPSINCMLDTADKAAAQLEFIEATGFKLPHKLILDRSLNRRLDELVRTADTLHSTYPEINLELIANEGCLYHCPFKLAHDAHIAYAQATCAPDLQAVTNRTLGCSRYFFEQQHRIFKSPFIRPEDTHHYKGVIDVIKLCGRTRGASVLQRVVQAYLNGKYEGNLLELNDTMEHLTHKLYVNNATLPVDFFQTVSKCDKMCRTCGYCRALATEHVRLLKTTIPAL